MNSILIVGAGYVGSQIAGDFAARGHKVYALNRSRLRYEILKQEGITFVVADLTQPQTLSNLPPASWVVLAPAPDERSESGYRNIYLKGIGHFLQSRQGRFKPSLMIYLSSIGVYGERDGAWVDETTPLKPTSEREHILAEAEKQILNSGYPAVILRLAGIYGPGRNRLESVQDQKVKPTPGTSSSEASAGNTGPSSSPIASPMGGSQPMPESYLNLIHREDIVRAMPVLFEKARGGDIYLGCDDEPVKRSVFEAWICQNFGKAAAQPIQIRSKVGGKRCRNGKLKALGFSFKFPTFRESYRSFLTPTLDSRKGDIP